MDKSDILSLTRSEFLHIYEQYKTHGVRGIYLWGSITSDDFDPETSDIDSIAIVENGTDLTYETEIKAALLAGPLAKYEASLRFITPNELNGVEETGYLTQFIRPEVIVLDMPYWIHMAGDTFSHDTFALSTSLLQNIIPEIAKKCQSKYLPFTGKFHQKYFLKPFFRICYYLNQPKSIIREPFSYQRLPTYHNSQTDEIIMKLMKVRATHWENEVFYQYLPDFEAFLTKMSQGDYTF